MKNILSSFINYTVNLIITVFLSFSLVYAFSVTFKLTYGIKEVFALVFITVCFYSVIMANWFMAKISAITFVISFTICLLYFVKNPEVFMVVYNKAISTFQWLSEYIYNKTTIHMEYRKYTLYGLSIGISLIIYIFTTVKFNFFVLLFGGMSLFVGQWMIDYFIIYLSFYIYMFFIILCYIKHIYLKNAVSGKKTYGMAPAALILLSTPACLLVLTFAYKMPASDHPIQWEWMTSGIETLQSYVKTQFHIGNPEYFNISSTGFNEKSDRLGGNVKLDDTLVMKVDSSQGGIYLKGAVREQYTGYSWENPESELTELGQLLDLEDFNTDTYKFYAGGQILTNGTSSTNNNNDKITLKITYENIRTKTLFIPGNIQRLTFDGAPINVFLDAYGIPSSNKYLDKEFKYNVELSDINKHYESIAEYLRFSSNDLISQSVIISTGGNIQGQNNTLDGKDVKTQEQITQEISAKYLQLPAQLPERVRNLAHEITSLRTNDYDRVKAIERYLSNNYTYTLLPGDIPKDRDFVDYFLFDLKQGYCTYYASAMTVLARSIGIPARYVEGYVIPQTPTEGTTYEVTNKQAHAWVEVYFPRFGWMTFEPTAPYFQNLYDTSEETIAEENEKSDQLNSEETFSTEESIADKSTANTNDSEEELNDESENGMEDPDSLFFGIGIGSAFGKQVSLYIKFIVPIFLFILVWIVAFSPLRRKLRVKRLRKLKPKQRVIEMYKYFLRCFSLQGYKIRSGETPLQFAKRIEKDMEFNSTNFLTITDIFMKARYSDLPMEKNEILLLNEFYYFFPTFYKKKTGWVKYFIYNNLLGLI